MASVLKQVSTVVNKGAEFRGVSGWDGGGKIELFWEKRSGRVSKYGSVTWLAFNWSWVLDSSNSVLFPYWRKCVVKDWRWCWGSMPYSLL